MKDGLYRVVYRGICAGFVIRGGRVIMCAPILRKRFHDWQRIAEFICP